MLETCTKGCTLKVSMSKTDNSNDEGTVIFRMTITLKNGKVIRRANGKPFKIVIKK